MKYAENLTVREFPDFTEVTVRNPQDTLKTLQKYILVERDSEMPAGLPEGTIIKVPVTNALVYSTVHNSLITELGAIERHRRYLQFEVCKRQRAAGASCLGAYSRLRCKPQSRP